jgi:2-keto-4-pentenoate hydratase
MGTPIQSAPAGLIAPTAGWKLAASGRAPQEHFGIQHPLIGRLAADRQRAPGARLSTSQLRLSAAEPEFAIVVGSRPSLNWAELSNDELLELVETVRLAIEVPESRFRDRDSLDAPTIVADNAWDGYYLIGPEVADWRQRDLSADTVGMLLNGAVVASASGATVVGGPLSAFCWLARELPRLGATLAAGDVIITGSLTWPVAVQAGDAIVADFGGLGKVEVWFDD